MNEQLLVEKLIKKNYKIATAESCTGGLLAGTIINVPSASKVIEASFVTYSNEAKTKLCGVLPETIEKFNVVSENVAKEMAEGTANANGAEVGVGITGIAGPSGGTKEIPVGMVCFGFYVNGKTITCTFIFEGNRNEIRAKAVDFAINMLIELL